MKTKITQSIFLVFLLIIAIPAISQSAKKLYKSGKEYSKIGNFEKAIELYSEAIEQSPDFTKAFEARANAYLELSKYEKAASDFESLSELEPKKTDYTVKAGLLYYKAEKYNEALPLLNTASELEPQNDEIQSTKSKCYFALKDYSKALAPISKAINLKPSAENYYQRGLVYSELKNFKEAEADFVNSLQQNANNSDAYNQLAFAQIQLGKEDAALESLNNSLKIDNKNKTALLLRSHIYKQKLNFTASIADLTSLIKYYPDETKFYLLRGSNFFENKEYNNAITDLSKVIEKEKDNIDALEKRATCYELLNDKKQAITDYKVIKKTLANTKIREELKNSVNKKLYELQREKNAPLLAIIQKKGVPKKTIEVPEGPDEATINVKITDQSEISSFKVNGFEIPFNQDSIVAGQELTVEIVDQNSLKFEISDVYNNKTTEVYNLLRKDTGFPRVVITSPISPAGNKIYLNSLNTDLEISGRIVAKYKIKQLLINDFPAQYNAADDNPAFKANLDIKDLNELSFDVIDVEGNHLSKKYILDRSDAQILSENPMGRTWVVFIENSDYNNFTNLEGPKKEVDLMIKALSKYQIDNIVHKRNMTKSQMDWFFRTELKKLVKENRVNSILLWYAGHGKFVNEKGYWIPVDSKVDDSESYYTLSSLKSAMKSYVDQITHSLIVTDACESGPSFYMSMRSVPTDRDCNDGKSTRFKSSQVFASSGDDLADGDSQFTKTFANSLIFNSKSCIPIEKIVTTVSSEVLKANNKRPAFGKISGFTDENGSFIFIKK